MAAKQNWRIARHWKWKFEQNDEDIRGNLNAFRGAKLEIKLRWNILNFTSIWIIGRSWWVWAIWGGKFDAEIEFLLNKFSMHAINQNNWQNFRWIFAAEDEMKMKQKLTGANQIASISVNQTEMESSIEWNNGISGLRTTWTRTFFFDCAATLKLVCDSSWQAPINAKNFDDFRFHKLWFDDFA